jgi:hypothetical protein
MTHVDRPRRRIQLKHQALPLIREEIIEDQLRRALLLLQAKYEEQIGDDFNPELSRRLDALAVLLDG